MEFLSKYTLGVQIGKGFSGTVFECFCRKTGKKYACKIISGMKEIERNCHEIKVMKTLSHKNINNIKEIFYERETKNPRNYIITDFADKDLFDYTKQHKTTENSAKHFTKQILQVVNYLHINNICHCDLKHENFLCFNVSNEDYFENVSLKLIDFEFSKYTHNNIGKRKRLIGRSGTISFMAPEMLKKKTYTELVDMWSVGVITYSMLYHTYPIVYQHIEIPESFNVNYFNNPNISDNAVDFVKNLLVEDPKNRMTSHEALNHEWLQI
jgi:serine/threonine protein kinase